MITERIEKRQKEKEELQAQLAIEMNKQVRLSAPDIRAYLYALKHGDKNDENTKLSLIHISRKMFPTAWHTRSSISLWRGPRTSRLIC